MILKFTAKVERDRNTEYVLHAFDAEERRVQVLISSEVAEDFGLARARKKAIEKYQARRFQAATGDIPRTVTVRYGDFGSVSRTGS